MSQLIFRALERGATGLDLIRSRVLRFSLQNDLLRRIFSTRWMRLLTLFIFSCAFALATSCAAPLWVLLIGPFLYGVPHLFSSIRYFHRIAGTEAEDPRRHAIFKTIGAVFGTIFFYRLFVTIRFLGVDIPQLSEWKGSTYLELFGLISVFLLCGALYRRSLPGMLRGAIIIAPFLSAFALFPLWTIGALVLIHNFIAFVYWIAAAQSRADRRVAIFSLLLTAFLTAAIFHGAFDPLTTWFPLTQALGFASLTISDTGRMIAPWSESELLWRHACIAFAFGQALHYFVWLKAIPDQLHYQEIPTSFRQSLQLLRKDFGGRVTLFILAVILTSAAAFCFMSFQKARMVYFALAAFHGYLEIAGLGLGAAKPEGFEAPLRHTGQPILSGANDMTAAQQMLS